MLMLLSVIARGLRAKGLDHYQPPGVEWAGQVAEWAEPAEPAATGAERYAQVQAFIAASGGGG
jgi:hypothetical protein